MCVSFCSFLSVVSYFFFFNDTATTEIYTLSLHDALPICAGQRRRPRPRSARGPRSFREGADRKSTRLNSSHSSISYAVFCLKKKKKKKNNQKIIINIQHYLAYIDLHTNIN